jgi:hypothetical protein
MNEAMSHRGSGRTGGVAAERRAASRMVQRLFCLAIVGVIAIPAASGWAITTMPVWRYTFEQPAGDWFAADFDDAAWQTGPGGFGSPGTPGARIFTRWARPDIWLRRTVTLEQVPQKPALYVHHDEDATIYLNGTKIATLAGYETDYQVVPLDAEARKVIRAGDNLLAVHCRQTGGGQYIDVHLIDADQVPDLPLPPEATKPFDSPLMTRWGAEVTADTVWQEYPRPQMRRDDWINLNGHWNYAITKQGAAQPDAWQGEILVPFCLESKLSGVGRLLLPNESLWYERRFTVPAGELSHDKRWLLHFEAVDYECRIWVNDQEVGAHVGGNVPFSMDVSGAIQPGENRVVVRVEDATGGAQLRGKQRQEPGGIWYTRVSGIWQTVWLEPVPRRSIRALVTRTDHHGRLQVTPRLDGPPASTERLRLTVLDGQTPVAQTESSGDDTRLSVTIADPQPWSPEQPHLYDLRVELLDEGGRVVDRVDSYTGLRTFGKVQDEQGHWRLTLNDKIYFHWGTLDQGWWPDGLLTPPSDEAMRYDIEVLKNAGFNMIRKHIKVEPRRYYYHCDRLGMLVWQDHVSGGENPPWTRLEPNPRDADWSDADHQQFMIELEAMIDALESVVSIAVWVPFNEAWGQHRTVEVGRWTVERDPTRIVNIASGGNFWPIGDVADEHWYPMPRFPLDDERFNDYVKVVGEFGGHGWLVKDHIWDVNRGNWGYGGLPKTEEEFKARYAESLNMLRRLKQQGIAAGVYTQTTDVEEEINGLMTYDRKVIKIPVDELKAMHAELLE